MMRSINFMCPLSIPQCPGVPQPEHIGITLRAAAGHRAPTVQSRSHLLIMPTDYNQVSNQHHYNRNYLNKNCHITFRFTKIHTNNNRLYFEGLISNLANI